MSTIGVRELARHASSIINDIEQKKEPALVTRRGRPVVYMLPVDSEEFEDFVLAHAPQFVDGIAAADAELAAGETVSFARLLDLLEEDLAAEPQPANLDIKALTGRAPWLRLRRGEYRILYRPLMNSELRALAASEPAGFLVERVVDRGDLERAASALPS